MPSRRKTREFVLQVLFAADAQNADPTEAFETLANHFSKDEEGVLKLYRVVNDYAIELVEAVSREREDIDALIAAISTNWKLRRMNQVDRNILRMAVAEMVTFPDVPSGVILNEAIDIGKKYGADNSAAFINGILDRINALGPRPTSARLLRESLTELDQVDSKV